MVPTRAYLLVGQGYRTADAESIEVPDRFGQGGMIADPRQAEEIPKKSILHGARARVPIPRGRGDAIRTLWGKHQIELQSVTGPHRPEGGPGARSQKNPREE